MEPRRLRDRFKGHPACAHGNRGGAYATFSQEARMARKAVNETDLVKKIHELPQEQINVVDKFVDFLRARRTEHSLRNAMTAVSDPVFERIWDNPEDAAYDKL
jgi:hypothetical protein